MQATNITWETDGKDVDLPTEIDLPEEIIYDECGDIDFYSISRWLEDTFGWLTESFGVEE